MPIKTDKYYTNYTGEDLNPTADAPYRLIINKDDPNMGGRTIFIPDYISEDVAVSNLSVEGFQLDLTYHIGMKEDGTFPIIPGVYTQRYPRISRLGFWWANAETATAPLNTEAKLIIEVLNGATWKQVGISDNTNTFQQNSLAEWSFQGLYDDATIDESEANVDNGLLGRFSDSKKKSIMRFRLVNAETGQPIEGNVLAASVTTPQPGDTNSGGYTVDGTLQPWNFRGYIQFSGDLVSVAESTDNDEQDRFGSPHLTREQLEKLFEFLNDETEIDEESVMATVKVPDNGDWEYKPPEPEEPEPDFERVMELLIETTHVNEKVSCFDVLRTNVEGNAAPSLTIDWGDGNEHEFVQGETDLLMHAYAEAGEYTIKIKGIVEWGQTTGSEDVGSIRDVRTVLKKIIIPDGKNSPIYSLQSSAFAEAANLVSVPSNLFSGVTKKSSLASCFYGCSSLLSVPEGLFDFDVEVDESAASCFESCTSLISVPSNLFAKHQEITDFWNCFWGCSYIRTPLPELWVSHESATSHTDCFHNCLNASNYESVPEDWGGYDEYALRLHINTSQQVDGQETVDLGKHIWEGPGDPGMGDGVYINWGDGSDVTYVAWPASEDDPKFSHKYATNGAYTITLHGAIKWTGSRNGSTFFNVLNSITIPEGKESSIVVLSDYAFYNAINLTSVPDRLFNNSSMSSFRSCFEGCTSLQAIHENLFVVCTAAKNFGYCFRDCSSITAIPAGLFASCTEATSFGYCFYGCNQIASIPEDLFSNCKSVDNFEACFYGNSGIKSDVPELWKTHESATSHSNCFSGCTSAANYRSVPQSWGGPEAVTGKMQLYIDNSNLRNYTFRHIDLGNIFGDESDNPNVTGGTIDWGDGSPETVFSAGEGIENRKFQHSYDDFGEHIVTITGRIKWGNNVNDFGVATRGKLTKIVIPDGEISPIYDLGRNPFSRSYIESVPAGLFDNCTEVTDFTLCFDFCDELTTIPAGLFDKCTKVTTFSGCFSFCQKLQEIPADLFKYNTEVESFTMCFWYCDRLARIPQDLFRYNIKVKDFNYCFTRCSSITEIPQDLFKYNTEVTSFDGGFSACRLLKTVPDDVFNYNTKATDFYYCFQHCTSLAKAPELWLQFVGKDIKSEACFDYCEAASNWEEIPELWGGPSHVQDWSGVDRTHALVFTVKDKDTVDFGFLGRYEFSYPGVMDIGMGNLHIFAGLETPIIGGAIDWGDKTALSKFNTDTKAEDPVFQHTYQGNYVGRSHTITVWGNFRFSGGGSMVGVTEMYTFPKEGVDCGLWDIWMDDNMQGYLVPCPFPNTIEFLDYRIWENLQQLYFFQVFRNTINLKSVPKNLFNTVIRNANAKHKASQESGAKFYVNLKELFKGSGITSFDDASFDALNELDNWYTPDFSHAFNDCNALTQLPRLWERGFDCIHNDVFNVSTADGYDDAVAAGWATAVESDPGLEPPTTDPGEVEPPTIDPETVQPFQPEGPTIG